MCPVLNFSSDMQKNWYVMSTEVCWLILSLLKLGKIKYVLYGTASLRNRLVRRHNIDHVINDEHNRIIIVVLAKHEIATWWCFLREPKHVGAIVGILIVLTFLWFYNYVHQLE